MQVIKKILKSKAVQEIICRIAWVYIWFVYVTTKWQRIGFQYTKALTESDSPFIFVFWHGRLLMVAPFAPRKRKLNVVISTHRDGQIITRVMEFFGFNMIRGSSSKIDGVSAFKEVIRALKNKEIVTITPDGPRGPRMRISGNVIRISQMQQVPIIPVTYSVSKCTILNTWDKFMFTKPFAKGVFIYGQPIPYCTSNTEEDIEQARLELENKLNELTKEADIMMGLKPIEPEQI